MSEHETKAMIHFWGDDDLAACGLNIARTPDTYGSPQWDEVTHDVCLAKRPTPLAAGSPARHAELLAECERIEAQALAEIRKLQEIVDRARRVKARLAAQNASPVPAATPAAFLASLPGYAAAQRERGSLADRRMNRTPVTD
jgi:hypothetical protein